MNSHHSLKLNRRRFLAQSVAFTGLAANDGGPPCGTIRDDMGETKNLADQNPDKVKTLHTRLIAWRKEVNAVMPTPNNESPTDKNHKSK